MTKKRRRRHAPEQIVKKLREAEAMLNSGKDLAAVVQALEVIHHHLCLNRRQSDG